MNQQHNNLGHESYDAEKQGLAHKKLSLRDVALHPFSFVCVIRDMLAAVLNALCPTSKKQNDSGEDEEEDEAEEGKADDGKLAAWPGLFASRLPVIVFEVFHIYFSESLLF